MDNQKPNDGNARNTGLEGSGSSMGKDMNTGSTGNKSGSPDLASKTKELINDAAKKGPELHQSIDRAADAAQPVVDRAAAAAHASVDKVTGALSGASATMDEKARQLTEAYRNFTSTGREYVRSSPGKSILVALAAGFTLSKLLSSRSKGRYGRY